MAFVRLSPPAFQELLLHTSGNAPVPEKECRNCGAPPAAVRCFYCGELARSNVRIWIRGALVPVYCDPEFTGWALAVHPWGDETELLQHAET